MCLPLFLLSYVPSSVPHASQLDYNMAWKNAKGTDLHSVLATAETTYNESASNV